MTRSRMTKRTRLTTLSLTLALATVLAACSDFSGNPGTPEEPAIAITGPFEVSGDGSYTGTVAENQIAIVGTHNGAVERLRYKLNEIAWLDATLTDEGFSFTATDLSPGSNTIALRLDGTNGQVRVGVIVVDYTTGGDPVVTPDPAAYDLVALTDGNMLTFFNSSSPSETDTLIVEGIEGTLLGMDFRPANGLLYALSSTNTLYTIDTGSGVATEASQLSEDFVGRARSGVDFNPSADRLRITGSNGQNFRVDVDTGEVTLDGDLAFVPGDSNEGLAQHVTASAYTNSVDPAPETTVLYNLDASLNALLEQDPPNDGGLATVGALGVDVSAVAGFDIVTDDAGTNMAYAASAGRLYTVDLETGTATLRGLIDEGEGDYQGLSVMMTPQENEPPVPTPDPEPKGMVALGANNTLVRFNSASPENGSVHTVRGVDGTLVGIDQRPATGRVYGLSDSNKLYIINLSNGRARQVSRLSETFEAGSMSGVDFNPSADRLRITGGNGQNFRVDVDTGEVTLDGTLSYTEEQLSPGITASAYTNSVDPAPETTTLYNLDAGSDSLVLQDPPNDGGLQTVGAVGFDVPDVAGFDIFSGEDGSNTAYAVAGASLYLIDLESSSSTLIGTLPGGSYQGLTVVSAD